MIRRGPTIKVILILGLLLVCNGLLTHAPDDSCRGSGPTRLTQLRAIALASHNWASTSNGRLVMQEVPMALDEPTRSWSTELLPFLDQASLYERIDPMQPWYAPVNRKWYQCEVGAYQNPALGSLSDAKGADGFALNHYAANQHVAASQSISNLDDISRADGLSNTLMYGEAAGQFKPWGEPDNWRNPMAGLNVSPDGFGGPDIGVAFVFCDCHVKMLSPDIDPSVLKAISTPDGGEQVSKWP